MRIPKLIVVLMLWWIRRHQQKIAILLVVFLAGCGSSPTAPSPQPPSLVGQWTGTYSPTNCTTTGAATGSGFCDSVRFGGGMVFTPQQAGSNLTGTLAIGAFNVPVSGTVDTGGVVVLSGTASLTQGAVLTLQTWRGNVISNVLSGAVQYTIVTDQPIGSATVIGSFLLTK